MNFSNNDYVGHENKNYNGRISKVGTWGSLQTDLRRAVIEEVINRNDDYFYRLWSQGKEDVVVPADCFISDPDLSQVERIYHFTRMQNIESIKKSGLLSWNRLEWSKTEHYPCSNKLSRDLDKHKNLEDYVRFVFEKSHPMLNASRYRGVGRIAWLEIDPSVLFCSTTKFSNHNANANIAKIDRNPLTAYNSSDSQAEILVLGGVPKELIINLEEV